MSEFSPAFELDSALHQAGVNESSFSSESLTLRELPGTTILRLHGFPGPETSSDRLPGKVGQVFSGNPAVLCIRPREWLLVSETSSSAELQAQVNDETDLREIAMYDNSDGLAVFRLSGTGAPWLLNKLSSLDFQSGVFAGAHCARAKMGRVAVVLHYHQTSAEQWVFDLIFDRSIARYLWELLISSSPHADELVKAFTNNA